jgi:hypothetical protein
MRSNVLFLKRLYPKTEMIDIAPFSSRWPTTGSAQLSSDWNQIDHRSTSAQLYEADVVLPTLNSASQNAAVKAKHEVQVANAEYQMINFTNLHEVCDPEVSSNAVGAFRV